MSEIEKGRRVAVRVMLNGRLETGYAEARMLLSDFLRGELGATDVHVGCEHGVCGCCTVLIDGVAARSCLALAVQADGARIDTVASLAAPDGSLNPLQLAFREHHALQCGFCTPGILMSLTDLLRREPVPSRERIVEVVSGHLCRCTGYDGIIEAAVAAAGRMDARRG
jgi:aerobic-type carbon monoxide dehydrogenase small subunit (CoxS/CutS family)